ncbi:hypothetical protein [Rhodococcus sp. MALMAid1271]|uniref:hypothetical protein n=1 Tax=Rhodococcus sp. MALMAid1271 TaxID=3411744 RepID=UPI003B9ED1DE
MSPPGFADASGSVCDASVRLAHELAGRKKIVTCRKWIDAANPSAPHMRGKVPQCGVDVSQKNCISDRIDLSTLTIDFSSDEGAGDGQVPRTVEMSGEPMCEPP